MRPEICTCRGSILLLLRCEKSPRGWRVSRRKFSDQNCSTAVTITELPDKVQRRLPWHITSTPNEEIE
jgi:hypothetical protein